MMSSPLTDPVSRLLLLSGGDRINNNTSLDIKGRKEE